MAFNESYSPVFVADKLDCLADGFKDLNHAEKKFSIEASVMLLGNYATQQGLRTVQLGTVLTYLPEETQAKVYQMLTDDTVFKLSPGDQRTVEKLKEPLLSK